VRCNGRATGIVVEDAIWDRLKLIAAEEGVTLSTLIGEIDRRFSSPRFPASARSAQSRRQTS
jgi:predicted DNA-binding ribbon-helix-helix protein